MRFRCSKEDFQKTLSMTENATTGKAGLQILSNVLINAKENKLVIIGTDQEISIIGECEANVENDGTLTLNAKKMLDILKTFPNSDIEIDSDDKFNISVKSLEKGINAKFRLQGVSPEDFPEVEHISDKPTFEIPQHILTDMIRRTIYATSKEESRYFLQGIFFEKENDSTELRLVATDGHRLSLAKNDFEDLQSFEGFKAMIPQKPMQELAKILSNEGNCEISITQKRGFFKVGKMEISTIFIETDFLNYQSVMPNNLMFKLIAKTGRLLSSINRVKSILESKERRVKFEIKANELNIMADNPNMGEAKETLDVEYDGDEISIGLNYEYMTQTMREIKSENLIIEIGSSVQPIVIKEENNESSVSVIGPMRLD